MTIFFDLFFSEKVGQGQHSIIIWTILIGPTSQMRHTQYPIQFQKLSMGFHGGHLGHVTRSIFVQILFTHPTESSYEIWVKLA